MAEMNDAFIRRAPRVGKVVAQMPPLLSTQRSMSRAAHGAHSIHHAKGPLQL